MKTKFISLLLLFVIVGCLSGCGNEKGSSGLFSGKLKSSDLSIKDFDWETKQTYISGEEVYAMNLTNNSKFDLLAVEIDYKVKDDASDSDLGVYDNFMNDHADWFDDDETARDITLIGSKQQLIKKGEQINQVKLRIGMGNDYWYDNPDNNQFNLMEPDQLQLGIIKDNILYVAYYDFKNESWKIDETTKEMNTWSKNEFAKDLEKPVCDYYLTTSDLDDEDDIDYTVYGTTKEYFKEYVEKIKSNGFTVNASESFDTYFTADDKNGNSVSIDYDEETNLFEVNINLN